MIAVGELMTRDVVALRETDVLARADELLRLRHIRHLPVVRGKKLVGLVTMRDLLRALALPPGDRLTHGAMAMDVMARDVETVREDTALTEAIHRMRLARFSCLPVVDEQGNLIGILTEADLVRYLVPLVEDLDRRLEGATYDA